MIPYNTDAPLYHLPIATVSLIVINTVLFLAVPSSFISPEFDLDYSQFEQLSEQELDSEDAFAQGTDSQTAEELEDVTAQNLSSFLESSIKYPSSTLALQHGAGIKPWQWVTSIFMHASFGHLLFNMIALWAFGLVVEGKVGWLQFLGLYIGVGVVQSGLEQLVMCLHGSGASIGASAAIFGILGVAVVWAPRNEFDVFFAFGFRAGSIEVPILMFGFLQFVLEAINIALGSFQMSSGVMHMMGFALGIGLGFVWLTRGLVDCEGWDLITVLKGNEGRDLESERLEREAAELVNSSHRSKAGTATAQSTSQSSVVPYPPAASTARPAAAVATREPANHTTSPPPTSVSGSDTYRPIYTQPPPTMDDLASLFAPASVQQETPESILYGLIENGQHQEALRQLVRMRKAGEVEIPQPQLARLIRDLLTAKDFTNSIPLMAEHIRRFSENRVTLQINLSKLLLQRQRPDKALQVLNSIKQPTLDMETIAVVASLIEHAKGAIATKNEKTA